MSWVPTFQLLASNGTTPVYTFDYIINRNYPNENPRHIALTNNRGVGEIIIPQGKGAWDYLLEGVLLASFYSALETKKASLLSTVLTNTRYVLRVDTSPTTYADFKVMRLSSIEWGNTNHNTYQYFTIILRVDTWV